jgi:pyruvate,water dikinase
VGLGEAVVGHGDDGRPRRREGSGRIRSRTTADKAVHVAVEQGTEGRPVPAADRARPVLDDAEAATLAALGVRIQEWFGAPQDVEWARSGGTFAIVQSRPITALPEAAAPPPTDWTVPDPSWFYVRASIVEQLPDPLSPLFAELVDGSVTRSLQALFGELLGRSDVIRDGDVALPTVNGYGYYRYSRRGMVRVTLASFPAFRALLRRGRASLPVRWREQAHPQYVRAVEHATARPSDGLPNAELLDDAAALLDAGTTYYTAVQTIIPLAATSETTFTRFYERLVRRAGEPPAATFLLGFDSAPIRAEQSLYDLAAWTRTHPALTDALRTASPDATVAAIDADAPPARVDAPTWQVVRPVQQHLARHGHTVSQPRFRGSGACGRPGARLGTLRFYWTAAARTRNNSAAQAARTRTATTQVAARLDRCAGPFRRLLRWAQAMAPLRGRLADVGLAWPQLRRMSASSAPGWWRRASNGGRCSGCTARISRSHRSGAEVGAAPALWRGKARRVVPRRCCRRAAGGEGVRPLAPASSDEQTGAAWGSARAPGRSPPRRGCSAAGRLRPPAAGRRAGREHHHAGVDDVVRHGGGGRDGHRRPAEPQLDRGPRGRHPGGARHERRDAADPGRLACVGGRRPRHRHPARRRRAIRLTGPAARTRPPAARPG